jgi:uncharacterized protein (TIGR03083 family)
MAGDSVWPVVHAERRALVEDLRSLPPVQWLVPSLCARWSVREVLGHLTATARMTPTRFVLHLAAAGFSAHRLAARDVRRETSGSPEQQLAALEALADASTAPPGPVDAVLGEIIVHGEDIRRPLGIPHAYPAEAVVRVADFYRGSNLRVGSRRRIAGLRLEATDVEWATGTGPVVSGPILSLVLAMTGRPPAEDLSGPGLAELAEL